MNHPLADADSAPWWDALERGQLLIQCCTGCQRLRWPARAICNDCGSFEWRWIPATGRGTIASWTVTHRSAPADATPTVVVMVRLDDQDDIFMPGFVDGPDDGSGLSIGLPVNVGFDEVAVGSDGWRLSVLRWRRL
ncbi:Zn-ribbon domain-containing OB-fold protein [Mycolicibacterium stellerae]|uniref:Zn-ribbon domain-containing OB-fold protein n=1 Tax=Mycolicibacterium stellerae TaxID=2358193 RepID=UPI0013DDEE34|nr:OB-fold domain-containing protein [Mycolicibacterium stellerae]